MDTFSYSDLLSDLNGFDAWLTSLGLTPRPNDRIHAAFNVLRRAEELSRKGRETGIYSYVQPEDWFKVVEALEAHEIFLAFKNDYSIARALRRALCGPQHPARENEKNRDGRNVWFELALAAEWRVRGASIQIAEPDFSLTHDQVQFLVACKRPASIRTIETNIDEAVGQLQRNLDKASAGTFGVAAISLTRALNRGDKVFSGGMRELSTILDYMLDQHRRHLAAVEDPRICCVLFHVATPSIQDGVDIARFSLCAAQELHRSVGSQSFARHAQEMRMRSRG